MGRTAAIRDRARQRWDALPRWVQWPVLGGAALGALGVLLLVFLWFTVDLPDDPPDILESAVVLSADGEELAVLSKGGQRFEVPLGEVAPIVVDALIAAEDRRFYSHDGVDPIGIGRALWTNLRSSRTEGGSTLTQQLVKNEYLSSERTLWRKAREAVLSVKLERTADKDEILERYLNTVYFGRGAYGIEAAARNYFDTSAAALDLPQAALLVGLLRSPETADPAEDMEEAASRRAIVLQDLVETEVITPDEAAAAEATPITATPRTSAVTLTAGLAPHFVEWVRQQTIDAIGEDALYSTGLRVFTTLDPTAQAAAEAAVAEVLTEPGPQAALVALDTDGAIRAHVGGRDFNALQVDLVRGVEGGGSGRQPGSSFKPFVLEAALESGITLGDSYAAPATIDLDVDGVPFVVNNYGGEGFGDITVAQATANSVNTVYAQLLAEVGPDAVVRAATLMGIDTDLEPVPSIALGVEEVSPLDLASAYLTLADDGTKVEPYGIVRIEDADGRLLWEPDRPEPEEAAIDTGISRTVTQALRGVIDNGTGQAAGIGRPAAGKTGTTQDNLDAWFAGYVPGYAAVVWMGFPEPAPMNDFQGRSVTGGSFPAQIWARFMEVALEGRDVEDFPAPPDELVDAAEPAALALDPAEADPGATIVASGTGFELCESWSVAIEGTEVASEPESGSSADARATSLTLPEDIAPGSYQVVARCDSSDAASATLVVRDPATSTSTSSSTTTTDPDETTTTTGESTTTSTSTTEPPEDVAPEPP